MAKDLKGKQLPKGIHQRENGLYVGRFKYNNKQYTFYDRDLEQLKKTLEDKKYEVRNGLYEKEQNITVDQWFIEWLTVYKVDIKNGTIQTYKQAYNSYIKKSLGKRKLKDIRGDMIQNLINDLDKKGLSYSRINIVYVILFGMLKKASVLHIINSNPLGNGSVTLPAKKKKEALCKTRKIKSMSLREKDIFLKYAKDSPYYDFYVMALSTGMRIGEILALHWSDIDFSLNNISINGTLIYSREEKKRYIDNPKSSSSNREIPMTDRISTLLKKRKTQQNICRLKLGEDWKEEAGLENLVFTYDTGGAYWDTAIRVDMNKIVDTINKNGIPFKKITPHSLRHTFATLGIKDGIDPKDMQELLGHGSFSITMDVYRDVLPDDKRKAMEKIQSIM